MGRIINLSNGAKGAAKALSDAYGARMARAADHYPATTYHGTADDIQDLSREHGGKVTKARSAEEAFWSVDNPDVAAGYARLAAEDAPVQKLIDESMSAERAGDWDLAHDLMVKAEKLEPSLVGGGGQNVMPLRIDDSKYMEIDAGGATMSDLDESQLYKWITEAKEGGYKGLKIKDFSDNADWGNYVAATHYATFDPADARSVNAKFDPENIGKPDLLGNATPEMLAATAGLTTAGIAGANTESFGDKALSATGDAIDFAFGALEIPARGLHGIGATLGVLAEGGTWEQAIQRGAQVSEQSIDQTAQQLGEAVADRTGSAPLAAITHGVTQVAAPF